MVKELPNILLVDDVPANLMYLKIILAGVEANLIEAESGFEALRKIEGIPLALAILDVQMAGMNGYELAIEINDKRKTDSVPIIFLTAAFPDIDHILTGYEAGAVDYMIKPLNKKILISKVITLLLFFNQKQRVVKSYEELKRSELIIQQGKEKMQLLNRHIINAREDERSAISLMIHDELGQSLTALKIDLSWMREHRKSEKAANKLEMMLANTNDIIRKVQRISSELHPKILTELGLADAIEWYCGEQHDRTGLIFELSLEDVVSKDFTKDLALYRILQEAVTNVIRHAGATKVIISIKYEKSGIRMMIADDGVGINPDMLDSSISMGLLGMRERAAQCSGTLELSLNEPSGTRVTVFLPTSNINPNEDINS